MVLTRRNPRQRGVSSPSSTWEDGEVPLHYTPTSSIDLDDCRGNTPMPKYFCEISSAYEGWEPPQRSRDGMRQNLPWSPSQLMPRLLQERLGEDRTFGNKSWRKPDPFTENILVEELPHHFVLSKWKNIKAQ